MIQVTIYNAAGKETGQYQLDAKLLGEEVRPELLKQAYVRVHANKRRDTRPTLNRSAVSGSTRKMYKQKGTGNARRGDRKTNLLRGGGHGHAKVAHGWEKDMPRQQRRLANRNAILAKAVDGEIKLIDGLAAGFDKPSTAKFKELLSSVKVAQSCLVALADTRTPAALSARNIPDATVTQIDRLNVFDLLNHRYLVAEIGRAHV